MYEDRVAAQALEDGWAHLVFEGKRFAIRLRWLQVPGELHGICKAGRRFSEPLMLVLEAYWAGSEYTLQEFLAAPAQAGPRLGKTVSILVPSLRHEDEAGRAVALALDMNGVPPLRHGQRGESGRGERHPHLFAIQAAQNSSNVVAQHMHILEAVRCAPCTGGRAAAGCT